MGVGLVPAGLSLPAGPPVQHHCQPSTYKSLLLVLLVPRRPAAAAAATVGAEVASEAVAKAVGIKNVVAEASPEDKLRVVEQRPGVLMVRNSESRARSYVGKAKDHLSQNDNSLFRF